MFNETYCCDCDGIVTMEILDNGLGVCPFCDETLVIFPENLPLSV